MHSARHLDLDLPDESGAAFIGLESALIHHPNTRPIIVDFDGTLLVRNSTEAYLDAARPRQIAGFLLALLDLTRPWRFLPGANKTWIYSDWIRVLAVTVLLPWSALSWRRHAKDVARLYANSSLLDHLAARPPDSVCVATFGFRFIVSPLLKAIAPGMTIAVAGTFLSGFRLRRSGKAAALVSAIGAERLSKSLVITDSLDDADLTPFCATLSLIDCPEAAHRRAHHDCYLPFYYLSKAKRSGEKHVLRQILYRDLIVLWISYAIHATAPLVVGTAIVCLQLSYWIIYEIGYWENDVIGSQREAKPILGVGFAKFKDRFSPTWAWVLGLLVAGPAAVLLDLADAPAISKWSLWSNVSSVMLIWCIWSGYLFSVRFIYWIYNRIDPLSRVLVYPALQMTKNLGFVVLMPISLVGAALCASLTIARWIPYIVYRYGGARWETPNLLIHLGLFNFLLFVAVITSGLMRLFIQPEAIFIEAWLCFHARKEIATLARSFVWLRGRDVQRSETG